MHKLRNNLNVHDSFHVLTIESRWLLNETTPIKQQVQRKQLLNKQKQLNQQKKQKKSLTFKTHIPLLPKYKQNRIQINHLIPLINTHSLMDGSFQISLFILFRL